MSVANRALAAALLIGAALPVLAETLSMPVGPAGDGSLVFEGKEKSISLGVAVAPEDIGKIGAIFVTAESSEGGKRYITSGGIAETPAPVFNGALPAEWQKTVDLEPFMRATSQKSPKEAMEPVDFCNALFPGMDPGYVVIEIGYSVGRAAADPADATYAQVAVAADRAIAKAKAAGRNDLAQKLMASKQRYADGMGSMKASKGAYAATDPNEADSFQSWRAIDFSCN